MIGDAIVFDGHMDTPLRIADDGFDISLDDPAGHVDLPRMRRGGLDAVFMAAWVDPEFFPDRALERAEELLAATRSVTLAQPEALVFATSAKQVRSAIANGQIALLAGVENGQALEDRLENIERLFDLGARYLTLTWMNSNAFADAADDDRHGGLSDLGIELVHEMNRLGMIVDLSHVSPDTFWDVLERTADPVVVSHSSTEVLGPHPRNLSDEQIAGVAQNGGLIGVNFCAHYLKPGDGENAHWSSIIDHLERIITVAGPRHAALGSDFDGVPLLPEGIEGIQDLPRIATELERRRWSDEDRRLVLGENWMRVLAAVVDRHVDSGVG